MLRIPVGIVVERRKSKSQWVDAVWLPTTVLCGSPETEPWTLLASGEETTTFYAGAAEIELYRSETDNYRANLASGAPSIWVALQATGGEPAYAVACVTVDPAEGEALTEAGEPIVETVMMPEPVRQTVADFVAAYHVERPFQKRARDRADPEAMARRAAAGERGNGR